MKIASTAALKCAYLFLPTTHGYAEKHCCQSQRNREEKRNDLTGIPLCRKCHLQRGQYGDEKFQRVNAIKLWKENAWLLIEFFGTDRAIGHMVRHRTRKGNLKWNFILT